MFSYVQWFVLAEPIKWANKVGNWWIHRFGGGRVKIKNNKMKSKFKKKKESEEEEQTEKGRSRRRTKEEERGSSSEHRAWGAPPGCRHHSTQFPLRCPLFLGLPVCVLTLVPAIVGQCGLSRVSSQTVSFNEILIVYIENAKLSPAGCLWMNEPWVVSGSVPFLCLSFLTYTSDGNTIV